MSSDDEHTLTSSGRQASEACWECDASTTEWFTVTLRQDAEHAVSFALCAKCLRACYLPLRHEFSLRAAEAQRGAGDRGEHGDATRQVSASLLALVAVPHLSLSDADHGLRLAGACGVARSRWAPGPGRGGPTSEHRRLATATADVDTTAGSGDQLEDLAAESRRQPDGDGSSGRHPSAPCEAQQALEIIG